MPDDEVVATDAALTHAAELGVDIAKIEGTGVGGKVTKADVDAAVAAGGGTTDTYWWYCLEARHPGANEVISDARFFESKEEGCPTCPKCGRQVTAVPAENKGIYPSSLLALAERLI